MHPAACASFATVRKSSGRSRWTRSNSARSALNVASTSTVISLPPGLARVGWFGERRGVHHRARAGHAVEHREKVEEPPPRRLAATWRVRHRDRHDGLLLPDAL